MATEPYGGSVQSRVLLSFGVRNFRSIRDQYWLHLSRSAREETLGFPAPDVVPAVAILGANASGKSNLLRALTTAFRMIRSSASELDRQLPYTPYMLGDSADEPTTLQLVIRI